MNKMEKARSMRKLPNTRYARIAGSAVAVGVIASTVYLFTRSDGSLVAPTYDIVLPQRTPVEALGGWHRVSPDNSDPVFAYSDMLEKVAISVSQQPMPESFAGNEKARIKELAESYSASIVVDAGGTEVYIGRSARGPQSVIFGKNGTLVLIKSQDAISQDGWIKYINNLVDPETETTPTF